MRTHSQISTVVVLGMDKLFHSTLYWACDYLPLLGLKLIHGCKGAPGLRWPNTMWRFRKPSASGQPWLTHYGRYIVMSYGILDFVSIFIGSGNGLLPVTSWLFCGVRLRVISREMLTISITIKYVWKSLNWCRIDVTDLSLTPSTVLLPSRTTCTLNSWCPSINL